MIVDDCVGIFSHAAWYRCLNYAVNVDGRCMQSGGFEMPERL
jgi:hypothetical protein